MDSIDLQSHLETDLRAAYDRLTADFMRIGRDPEGAPCFPDDDDLVHKLIQQAAARCGANVGAAVKREKRTWLLAALLNARSAGLDVTPAVVKGAAQRVLGRRLDERFVAKLFATPGRTAASKSDVQPADLVLIEDRLKQELTPLLDRINAAKATAHSRWYLSEERQQVLADWRRQRDGRSLDEFRFEKVGRAVLEGDYKAVPGV